MEGVILMHYVKSLIFTFIFSSINLYAISVVKIICDKDGEKIYLDGKLKTTCDKDDVIRLMVYKGNHTIDIRKKTKEARYHFSKHFFIGDGVQKLIEPNIQPIYNEYHYYKAVVENDDIDACNTYLQNYPHGKYVRTMREFQAYLKAKESFAQYQKYLSRYPNGHFLQKLQNYYKKNPLIATLQGHTKAVRALALTRQPQRLFSGADDETIIEWNLHTHTPSKKFTYAHNISGGLGVSALAISADEKSLYSNGRAFRVWDITSGTNSIIDKNFEPEEIYPYGSKLITLRPSRLDIWDLATKKPIFTYKGNEGYNAYMHGGAFSADKKYFYFGQYFEKFDKCGIIQLDVQNQKIVRRFFSPFLLDEVLCMALSPDGKYLITGTNNGANAASHAEHDTTLLMWDIQSGYVARILHQKGSVTALAVDPKHHIFASGSTTGEIKLWDSDTGAAIASFQTHTAINDLLFTKDGQKLIGALEDGNVGIWYMGFFSKQDGMQNLLQECKNGDLRACNDYLIYGKENRFQAKKALLAQLQKIVQSFGSSITYHNPTIYLFDRINADLAFPLKNNRANYFAQHEVAAIISNENKTYVFIHMQRKQGGFNFNKPIYLIQNGKKQNYTQRLPASSNISKGNNDTYFILIYDNFPLQNGSYAIKEGDEKCPTCLNLHNGFIIKKIEG